VKRCVHKLTNLQKVDFVKIAIEVGDMQTVETQLTYRLAQYILYGSTQFCINNNLPLLLTFKI